MYRNCCGCDRMVAGFTTTCAISAYHHWSCKFKSCMYRDCCGCDRMVVGFTTTCAISAYHHWSCEFKSCTWQDVLDTTFCDKVCQGLATGRWFSLGTLISSTNKTDCHDTTEILLKVALNTINPTNHFINTVDSHCLELGWLEFLSKSRTSLCINIYNLTPVESNSDESKFRLSRIKVLVPRCRKPYYWHSISQIYQSKHVYYLVLKLDHRWNIRSLTLTFLP